jgi:hypothetical protein
MADHVYDSADLETVATMFLIGPRNLRLEVLNVFRDQNGKDPVEYLVNTHTLSRSAVDNAVDNLREAAENAAPSGDFVADSADLETVFHAALTDHRKFRLDLVNIFRTAQDLDDVEYLVNAYVPTYDAFGEALEDVGEAPLD